MHLPHILHFYCRDDKLYFLIFSTMNAIFIPFNLHCGCYLIFCKIGPIKASILFYSILWEVLFLPRFNKVHSKGLLDAHCILATPLLGLGDTDLHPAEQCRTFLHHLRDMLTEQFRVTSAKQLGAPWLPECRDTLTKCLQTFKEQQIHLLIEVQYLFSSTYFWLNIWPLIFNQKKKFGHNNP